MPLPNAEEARILLENHVQDPYQRLHATMVAAAVAGYAPRFHGDLHLWRLTGLLHDIDFEGFPESHPAESLRWFRNWGYPEDLIHAVEAHAYGFNGFTILPRTPLASALLACDELCGIFYAYRRLNPVSYGQMKAASILKKVREPAFAAKIDRSTIQLGCDHLGVPLETHVANLVGFLAELP